LTDQPKLNDVKLKKVPFDTHRTGKHLTNILHFGLFFMP